MSNKAKPNNVFWPNIWILPFILLVVWGLAEAIANPLGNFPLNDDWNYARSVEVLLTEQRLFITCWSLAASLTHILLGYVSCAIFGFSFEHLRLIVLATVLIGQIVFYFWLKSINTNKVLIYIAIATLIFNPLYFELANTFMTDIPFITLAICTIYLFSRQINSPVLDRRNNLLTIIFATASCLSRQIGIVIPIAYLITLLKTNKLKGESAKNKLLAILPLIIPIIAIALFQLWLAHTTFSLSYATESHYLTNKFSQGVAAVMIEFLTNIIRALVYCGLFFLPALSVLIPPFLEKLERKQKIFFCALTGEIGVLTCLGLVFRKSLMPLADNILFNFGLGPILTGGNVLHPSWAIAPEWFLHLITYASTFAGAALVSILILITMNLKKDFKPSLYFYLSTLAIFFVVIFVRGFFDRYLIFAIPLIFGIIFSFIGDNYNSTAGSFKKLLIACSIVLSSLFVVFSALATHDYFSFNRARWQALEYLTDSENIPAQHIDGGLEFNGWNSYDKNSHQSKIVFNSSMKQGDDWIVSLDKQEGYELKKSFPFKRLLDGQEGLVLILKKN